MLCEIARHMRIPDYLLTPFIGHYLVPVINKTCACSRRNSTVSSITWSPQSKTIQLHLQNRATFYLYLSRPLSPDHTDQAAYTVTPIENDPYYKIGKDICAISNSTLHASTQNGNNLILVSSKTSEYATTNGKPVTSNQPYSQSPRDTITFHGSEINLSPLRAFNDHTYHNAPPAYRLLFVEKLCLLADHDDAMLRESAHRKLAALIPTFVLPATSR